MQIEAAKEAIGLRHLNSNGTMSHPAGKGNGQKGTNGVAQILILRTPDGSRNLFRVRCSPSVARVLPSQLRREPETAVADVWRALKGDHTFLAHN